jgi:hypothetical protein
MSRPHTQINLADVDDAAPVGGFGDRWEARVARVDLEAEQTGGDALSTTAWEAFTVRSSARAR